MKSGDKVRVIKDRNNSGYVVGVHPTIDRYLEIGDVITVKSMYTDSANLKPHMAGKTFIIYDAIDSIFGQTEEWVCTDFVELIEEMTDKSIDTDCVCDRMVLMRSGCKCGAMERERNAKANS